MRDLKKYKLEIIFFIAVVSIQLLYLAVVHPPLSWFDSAIYHTTATNFANGDGFMYTPGIPDALREPGYSFFVLAPLYAVFGNSILIAQIAQALLSGFTVVLIVLLGKRYLTNTAAIIAASLYAMHPSIIVNVGEIMTEGWFMFLVTLFVYLFLRSIEHRSWRWLILSAIVLGMAALTRMAILPFIFLMPVLLLWQSKNWKFSIVAGSAAVVVALMVYSPWIVRNYIQFDRLVLGRTGGGEIIWTGSYIPWDGDWQGYIWPLTEYQQEGDFFEHDSQMLERAKQNVINDPVGVAWIWLKKPLKIFFQPEGLNNVISKGAFRGDILLTLAALVLSVWHLLIVFFAALGMARFKKYPQYATMAIIVLVYFMLLYIPLNAVARYAVPLLPLIFLFAGLGFHELLRRPSHNSSRLHVGFMSLYAYGLFDASAGVQYGGAEVQLYNLARGLVKNRQADVSFITAARPQPGVEDFHGIRLYRVLSGKRYIPVISKIVAVTKLFYYVRKINADVYVQRALGPETMLLSLYCRILGKKFVYMIAHEWDVSGEYIRTNGLIGRVSFSGVRKADVIIAQNADQKKLLATNFQLDSTVLPSLYDIPETVPSIDERTTILWVGRAETWKQPDIFLELAAQLPNEHCVLIMPKGNYPEYYKTVMERANATPNITFIPEVHISEIDKYFQEAKLFINTSTKEGFPNTFIQAAKNGTPVLSLTVNPDGILERYHFGITANNSKDVLFSLTRELIANSQKREVMALKAHEYAKQHHDTTAIIQKFIELLRRA